MPSFDDLIEKIMIDLDNFLNWFIYSFFNLGSISFFRWIVLGLQFLFFYLQIKAFIYFLIYFYWYFYKYFFLILDLVVFKLIGNRFFIFYKGIRTKIDYIFVDLFFIIIPKILKRIKNKIKFFFSIDFLKLILYRIFFWFDDKLSAAYRRWYSRGSRWNFISKRYFYKSLKILYTIKFYLFNKLIRFYIKRLSRLYIKLVIRLIYLNLVFFCQKSRIVFSYYFFNNIFVVYFWKLRMLFSYYLIKNNVIIFLFIILIIFLFFYFFIFLHIVDVEANSECFFSYRVLIDNLVKRNLFFVRYKIKNNDDVLCYKSLPVEEGSEGYLLFVDDLYLIAKNMCFDDMSDLNVFVISSMIDLLA